MRPMSRTRHPRRIVALIVALVLVATACAEDDEPRVIITGENPATAPADVVGTAEREGHLTLVAALEAAELLESLREEGPFTLFAPTDAAFDALPDGAIPLLLEEEPGLLADLLRAHVAEGGNTSPQLLDDGQVTSLEGSTITVEAVEIPAEDEGVDPTAIVEVAGQAELTDADLLATNGVVHVIDTVLIPESLSDDWDEFVASIPEPDDALSTLEELGDFETFLTLIDEADLDAELVGLLTGSGPFTLFAPTDTAFDALTADQAELLETDPEVLNSVLQFHLLRQEVRAAEVSTERYVTTLEGEGARLSRTPIRDEDDDGNLIEVGATYAIAGVGLAEIDIVATNGIIHVVDELLVPQSARGPGGL